MVCLEPWITTDLVSLKFYDAVLRDNGHSTGLPTTQPTMMSSGPTIACRRVNLLVLLLLLLLIVVTADSENGNDDDTCDAKNKPTIGTLTPSDRPPLQVFDSFRETRKLTLPPILSKADDESSAKIPVKTTWNATIHLGTISQINRVQNKSNTAAPAIALLPNLMERQEVEALLTLLRNYEPNLDTDPDTVDGMPTYEIFVDSPDLGREGDSESIKYLDTDPTEAPRRRQLREQLSRILDPILNHRMVPFVRKHFAHVCNGTTTRACTPCYSLIRHYQHGQRQSHATHYDGHALVTMVTSLSDYGHDYNGGLYVSTGYGQRQFLALRKGDSVAHQSTLLHGVQVIDLESQPQKTERWSWIVWFRDSTECLDYSYQWFRDCANQGDAVCQELHASKVGQQSNDPARDVLKYNTLAANNGSGNAAVKVARAYLKRLPSPLDYNVSMAAHYYQRAVQCHHPDGHYGLAELRLLQIIARGKSGTLNGDKGRLWQQEQLLKVVEHLEQASLLGHAFSMFNLGIVHVYGYGTNRIDTDLAAEWLVESGLPEGYFVAAHQAQSKGNKKSYETYMERAKQLGYFKVWRKKARESTGSGGAGGVDLNLPWPPAVDGRRPPSF